MASGKYTSECREGKRRLKFKFFFTFNARTRKKTEN